MAKFGLYDQSGNRPTEPKQDYEGEYLELSSQGETVAVMENDAKGIKRIVAAIRLAQGQSVKKVRE
jgi:hypothetical protein